jgi:hypothetical protein
VTGCPLPSKPAPAPRVGPLSWYTASSEAVRHTTRMLSHYPFMSLPVALMLALLPHASLCAGKSRLLAAICLFVGKVAQAQAQHGSPGGATSASALRILLACATNVAVDRVLLELLEHGYAALIPFSPIPAPRPQSQLPAMSSP